LVSGGINGNILKNGTEEKLEFTWKGHDECAPASGYGWLKLNNKNLINREIKFHHGDKSGLVVQRISI